MIPLLSIFLFLVSSQLIECSINVIKPQKDSSFDASSSSSSVSVTVEWVDDDTFPTYDDLTSVTFTLITGENTDMNPVKTLASKVSKDQFTKTENGDADHYTYDVEISNTAVGGNGQFFIQLYAVYDGIGAMAIYSPRFSLKDMSGSVTTYTYSDTTQPSIGNYITNNPQDTTATGTTTTYDTSASLTVPYVSQTGPYRFAPMQQQPGSTVTAKTWTRRFPTSAVTYYSTINTKSLFHITTVTPGWSYTLTSDINYQTPDLFPSENGGWYDPSKRMSLTTRKINYSAHSTSAASPSSASTASTD
ncbi:hypothetical protein ACO0QE_002145 [Hanseniaspora vineae]